MPGYGQAFQPGQQESQAQGQPGQAQGRPSSGVQEAIQLLSLRIPNLRPNVGAIPSQLMSGTGAGASGESGLQLIQRLLSSAQAQQAQGGGAAPTRDLLTELLSRSMGSWRPSGGGSTAQPAPAVGSSLFTDLVGGTGTIRVGAWAPPSVVNQPGSIGSQPPVTTINTGHWDPPLGVGIGQSAAAVAPKRPDYFASKFGDGQDYQGAFTPY